MNTKTIAYIAAFAVLFLSACKVSKDITVPNDTTPVAFRDVNTTDTAGIAAIPWRSFFHDANLQRLIDSTIVNNFDMQVAVKNIEAAQLVVRQSRLGNLPAAAFQATAGVNR